MDFRWAGPNFDFIPAQAGPRQSSLQGHRLHAGVQAGKEEHGAYGLGAGRLSHDPWALLWALLLSEGPSIFGIMQLKSNIFGMRESHSEAMYRVGDATGRELPFVDINLLLPYIYTNEEKIYKHRWY